MNEEAVATGEGAFAFEPETVLKQDIFGRIVLGRLGASGEKAILRDLSERKWWAAPISAHLARREVRALKTLAGVSGVPRLLGREAKRIYRQWLPGVPLHVAEPHGDVAYFKQARAILAELRKRGVTHNDLAKPQNWLRAPDGRPQLLDFQLAHVHRRKGRLYRVMSYEDIRHLIKHKRRYCPEATTARERAIADRRSLPSRIWRKSGKAVYNLVTRRLLHWSDGEGGGDRLAHYGGALADFLERHPAVAEAAVTSYPHPSHRVEGLYAFAAVAEPADGLDLAAWSRKELGPLAGADLVQLVPALPRSAAGEIRHDLLRLVAQNLLDEIGPLTAGDANLEALMARIVAQRVNLSDRRGLASRTAAAGGVV
ncbi:MAG: serine/threonine protein kinase [Hyphomicrobiales bacterium]|nr:serine/threonine protein kinase [Hyphomicrobiales bacterium]